MWCVPGCQGCSALGNVALNMRTNAQMPLSVVDVILDALAYHRCDAQVQERGMKALYNLAGRVKGAPDGGPAARALKPAPQRGVNIYSTRLFSQVPTPAAPSAGSIPASTPPPCLCVAACPLI